METIIEARAMLASKIERLTAELARKQLAEAAAARDEAVTVALDAVEAIYSGVQEFLPRFAALDGELLAAMDNAYRAERRAAKLSGAFLGTSRAQDGWRMHVGLEQLVLALRGYVAAASGAAPDARVSSHAETSGG